MICVFCCRGTNDLGQATAPAALPAAVVSLAAGGKHTCYAAADGSAGCFGDDGAAQTTLPTLPGSVAAVAAGAQHSCAILQGSGSISCW